MKTLAISPELVLGLLKTDFILVQKLPSGDLKVVTPLKKLPDSVKVASDANLLIQMDSEFDEPEFEFSVNGLADKAAKELWAVIAEGKE